MLPVLAAATAGASSSDAPLPRRTLLPQAETLSASPSPIISYTDGKAKTLWNKNVSKKVDNVFWVHIPKTSTTFGRTVFSYACDPPDQFAHVATNDPPDPDPDTCDHLSIQQKQVALIGTKANHQTWFHSSAPLNVSLFEWGQVYADGVSVVTLMRRPAERTRSAFQQIRGSSDGHTGCCAAADAQPTFSNDWGWSSATRRKAFDNVHNKSDTKAALGFKLALEPVDSLWGCQTKMILGIGCNTEHKMPVMGQDHQRALALVNDTAVVNGTAIPGVAFVGFTDNYAESVCLYHIKFGGPLWDFEVDTTETPAFDESDPKPVKEPMWHGGTNDPDVLTFLTAKNRFDRELLEYEDEMEDCLKSLPENYKRLNYR